MAAALGHGLRVKLILEDWIWQAVDDAAAEIVATALWQIGAMRPTWLQRQREYTVSREDCFWCGSHLDDVDQSRGRRFCSTECAKSALVYRDYERNFEYDPLGRHANYFIRISNIPERTASNAASVQAEEPCSGLLLFEASAPPARRCLPRSPLRSVRRDVPSAHGRSALCSIVCKGIARRVLDDRGCANSHCGATFHPRQASSKYCCHECSIEGRGAVLAERTCKQCAKPFQPKNESALLCSPRCRQRFKEARQRARRQAARIPVEAANTPEPRFMCEAAE